MLCRAVSPAAMRQLIAMRLRSQRVLSQFSARGSGILARCIRIERVELRPGRAVVDKAHRSPKGYILAAPHFTSKERKQHGNATFVPTLDEAADLIENHGYHRRMGDSPERPSLIEPAEVRIKRA